MRARLDYLLSSLSHSRLHPRSRCRGVFLGFFLFSGKAEKTRIFWGQSQSTNRVRNAFDRSRGEENHLSLGRRSEGTQTRSAARSSTGTAGTLFRSSHGRGHGHEGAPPHTPPLPSPPPALLFCCETPSVPIADVVRCPFFRTVVGLARAFAQITLKSSDEETFEVDQDVANMSETIKNMIEGRCPEPDLRPPSLHPNTFLFRPTVLEGETDRRELRGFHNRILMSLFLFFSLVQTPERTSPSLCPT